MNLTRRAFLRRSVAAATAASMPAWVPARVLGQQAPSNRIGVGCIGVGPQGRGVMSGFLRQATCRVVALSDVFDRSLRPAVQMVTEAYGGPDVTVHRDFRELLAREDIDAVLIATPDHWHVPMSVAAAQAGKDMYLEKPMGLSIEEDQQLRRACQEGKRIFQFGTQQRSGAQFRQACELVRNGHLGRLERIRVWSSASRPGGSTEAIEPPADLDYPAWLGPAPKTPYTAGKAADEDGAWKTWWYDYHYALGFIAGWGVHPLDIAYWGHPRMMDGQVQVEGKGVIPTRGACNTSVAWDVQFRFADGVTMDYRGTRNGAEPSDMNDLSAWEKRYGRIVDHGTAFEGTEGWVLVDRTQIRAWPERLIERQPGPDEVRLTRSSNHVANFLEAVRTRTPAICPIEDSVQADILCHLSDIATRVDRPLRWDPATETFVGDAGANRLLKRQG